MGNLDKWEKLARPPETALKKIGGGRLKGMTDINPQWRYKAMTEVYGECGIGWKYTVERLWTEQGTEGQVMAFAQVSVCTRTATEPNAIISWSEPVPGVGGSMLIAKESGGLHTSDEAFKMAITDALSVAFKMLGVGADIYMGRWDGSKYKDQDKVADAIIKANVKPTNTEGDISPEEKKQVEAVAKKMLDWLNADSVEDAVLESHNHELNAHQRVYLTTFFDSKQRSAMGKVQDELKKKYLKNNEATQP